METWGVGVYHLAYNKGCMAAPYLLGGCAKSLVGHGVEGI